MAHTPVCAAIFLSPAGDAVFTHYSGHGGKLRDDDGDEKDGYDETLVPVDYTSKVRTLAADVTIGAYIEEG